MTPANVSTIERWSPEQRVAVAVSLAVALSMLALAMLSLLQRPSRYSRRVADLDAKVAQLETLRRRVGRAPGLPPNTVCKGPLLKEASVLRADLSRLGSQLHLYQLKIDTTPDLNSEGLDFEPVGFRLDGAADYTAAINLLQTLDRHQPAIVIDRVDLISQTSFLRLHLDGRVFCQTSAHS